MANLGYMLANGWGGMSPDAGQAKRLFEGVVNLGDKEGEGRVGLGYLHSRGLGVEYNPVKVTSTGA